MEASSSDSKPMSELQRAAAVAALAATLFVVGWLIGGSGGADVDAATAAGKKAGTAAGIKAGESSGFDEGEKKGYRTAYKAAYSKALREAGGD